MKFGFCIFIILFIGFSGSSQIINANLLEDSTIKVKSSSASYSINQNQPSKEPVFLISNSELKVIESRILEWKNNVSAVTPIAKNDTENGLINSLPDSEKIPFSSFFDLSQNTQDYILQNKSYYMQYIEFE